jgi:hypothetical protein
VGVFLTGYTIFAECHTATAKAHSKSHSDNGNQCGKKARMKLKSSFGYGITSVMLLVCSGFTLVSQWTQNINPNTSGEYGSYCGFLQGMWKGVDGLNFRDIGFGRAAYLVSDLITPYLLMVTGFWLCIAGHKRRKSEWFVSSSEADSNNSCLEEYSETVWPPQIKHN